MKYMTGNEARQVFLDYFQKNEHSIIRSSSLVPSDDPTLLFVNAGMVQFKRVFTGDEKSDVPRAVTSQKCVRAGGKHNDLENVGYTARHHTFFEMLGNFSFGDYFKAKAIAMAWDLLTNGYGFNKEKLYVSVYKDDDEAYAIWRDQEGVPEERIFRLGEEDNFWSMGDTGPCGPCSEIHIDRGKEHGCGRPECTVGCDCDRWLELWNLVFMQFERDEKGNMTPLPKPSIDTGMGLERIISVLQGVPTNFDTDLFVPIMEKVEQLSGKKRNESRQTEVAMKVIADHSRASAFLICDGVLPSNEGRGNVLRRIMRRAIRYGRSIGLVKPFFHKTVGTVFTIMDQAYPELAENQTFILTVVKNEEEKFLETLETGLKLLESAIEDPKVKKNNVLEGEIIFKLYDTYGFPVDIIVDHVKDKGISLDMDGFDAAMAQQKQRSRSEKKFIGAIQAYKELIASGEKTDFLGYEKLATRGKVLLLVKDGKQIQTASPGDEIDLVTDQTVFYAEAGGQVGDRGTAENEHCSLSVFDTQKDPSGIYMHKAKVLSGQCRRGDTMLLKVDQENRCRIASNHTATHILHAALGHVLGDHVKQAGSLVAPDRLRFDFTHFSNMSEQELIQVENYVNQRIRENHVLETRIMDMEEAVKSGATALFEEKYKDVVRVVSQGKYSRELCGGTHAHASGDIGIFKILSEAGIASGVRRIEAVTGQDALDKIHRDQALLSQASGLLKISSEELVSKVQALLSEKKLLEKELVSVKAKIASQSLDHIDEKIRKINQVNVLSMKVNIEDSSQLRDLADKCKAKMKSGILLLGAESNKKALLIAMVSKDLTARYRAGDIVRKAAAIVGGGGGGRPDMAQAGGTKPEHLDNALESVFSFLEE